MAISSPKVLVFLLMATSGCFGGDVTEKVACAQVDCSEGEFLVFTIHDCKLKAGLKEFSGNLRKSATMTPLDWAKGVADHLENGCTHREIQVSEIHCAELPYSVCNCNRSQIDFVRRTASVLKNCDKSLAATIYKAIENLPLTVQWDGNVVFRPPEPRPDSSSKALKVPSAKSIASVVGSHHILPATPPEIWCISEMTLASRQMFCEKQELGIVNKLLRGKEDVLEHYYAAKNKAAVALVSCLRTGLSRFSHCTNESVTAFLTTYYELGIAPGVVVPKEILNSQFIPVPLAKRALVGVVGTSHLLVSDRVKPLTCRILEVNNLLLSNDYFDLTAITPMRVAVPKFSQFFVSFYRAEMPQSPIVTIIVNLNEVKVTYTIDQHTAEDYVEISDTWSTENMLTIRDLQASSLIIFQRIDPDYMDVLVLMPTSILDHSIGYLVSGCDQQGLNLDYENEILRNTYQLTGPAMVPVCEANCQGALDWIQICMYDCLVFNDTKAATNVLAVQQTMAQLFPAVEISAPTVYAASDRSANGAETPVLLAGSTDQLQPNFFSIAPALTLIFISIFLNFKIFCPFF